MQQKIKEIRININELQNSSEQFLKNCGFNNEEAIFITHNILSAELNNKKSHGIIRLMDLKKFSLSGDIQTDSKKLSLVSHGYDYLYFDAEYQNGAVAMYRSLNKTFSILSQNTKHNIFIIGIKNTAYATGYIGDYAKMASTNGFIFLSFFNSPPVLIPHGSSEAQWGTNPLSFSFPKTDIIFDAASSKISWGEVINANLQGKLLQENTALDKKGIPTCNPKEAMQGGLLSMGEHKGSGIALMVELMAGALTGSRVGTIANKGWGCCYILIRPNIFRETEQPVLKEANELIESLCASQPRKEGKRVVFPGEKSKEAYEKAIKEGSLLISQSLWKEIIAFL